MRFSPEDFGCLTIHLVTFILILPLIFGLEFSVSGRYRWIYESWKELWVLIPLIFIGVNIVFVFIERSILGFIAILGSVGWFVYNKITFPIVLRILGQS